MVLRLWRKTILLIIRDDIVKLRRKCPNTEPQVLVSPIRFLLQVHERRRCQIRITHLLAMLQPDIGPPNKLCYVFLNNEDSETQ